MSALWFVAGLVIGLLLAETRVSRRHELRLIERGARAPSGDVYGLMAWMYPLGFVAMMAEGFWRASLAGGGSGPSWFASGLVMFAAAKGLKYWTIGSLGDRWSFRVFIEPGRPLVTAGPYRYVAHPNYVAVVGELLGVALMFRAAISGPVVLVLFGGLLWARIRFEERVLGEAGLWKQ